MNAETQPREVVSCHDAGRDWPNDRYTIVLAPGLLDIHPFLALCQSGRLSYRGDAPRGDDRIHGRAVKWESLPLRARVTVHEILGGTK